MDGPIAMMECFSTTDMAFHSLLHALLKKATNMNCFDGHHFLELFISSKYFACTFLRGKQQIRIMVGLYVSPSNVNSRVSTCYFRFTGVNQLTV